MLLIDARGRACPGPVMMADDALSKVGQGIVEVLVDHDGASLKLQGYAAQNGMAAEQSRVRQDWNVKSIKGHACHPATASGASTLDHEKAKTILMIVGTDVPGKDEGLGAMLMKGFFETMKVHIQPPHTLFFLNAGVRLTTKNIDTIPILKDIEAMGVEIYSCGTCLKHYDLESSLKVGRRGTTNHLVEGLQDFAKVVGV